METMDKTKEDFQNVMKIRESIEKASHDCGFLRDDISSAYSVACVSNQAMGILLYGIIESLAKIQNRINEIKSIGGDHGLSRVHQKQAVQISVIRKTDRTG